MVIGAQASGGEVLLAACSRSRCSPMTMEKPLATALVVGLTERS